MARSNKRGGKRNKRTKVKVLNRNTLKRRWKQMKKAKSISCVDIGQNWKREFSARANMSLAGLVYDVNKEFACLSTAMSSQAEECEVDQLPKKEESAVVKALKLKASAPKVKRLRLSTTEIKFIVEMMEKHGSNFKAMSKDIKNVFQLTPSQLQRRIEQFKKISVQYNAYLRAKGIAPSAEAQMETS